MLIIEGSDLVGKTAFAKRIVSYVNNLGIHPAIYQHLSKLPQCWDYSKDYFPLMNPFAVMDRFHMSEVVYRYARGIESYLNPEDYRSIDLGALAKGAVTVVIYCGDREELEKRIEGNIHREMFSKQIILNVNEYFSEIAKRRSESGISSIAFSAIGGRYAVSYKMFVDFTYASCTEFGHRYPAEDDQFLEMVVDRWLQRLEKVGLCNRDRRRRIAASQPT